MPIQPAISKSRPAQPGNNSRTLLENFQRKARPVIFYHYYDRSIVQPELPGRQPSKRIFSSFWKSGIETGLESPLFIKQEINYNHNGPHCLKYRLRSKGKCCDTHPG